MGSHRTVSTPSPLPTFCSPCVPSLLPLCSPNVHFLSYSLESFVELMLIFVICYLPPLLLLRYVNINHLVMVLRILYCMAVWMGAIMGVGTPLVSPLQARFHQHYKSRGYGTDHLLYGRSFVRVGFESYHPTLRSPSTMTLSSTSSSTWTWLIIDIKPVTFT
jgi:hypothetical protein